MKKIILVFLAIFNISNAWEVTTHRAIDRTAIENTQNLVSFIADTQLDNMSYLNERFEGYKNKETGNPITYFEYFVEDVRADENQTDPVGAQPVDVAKTYVQAMISNDRETVERLFGHNPRMIGYVYGNPQAQQFLAETYGKITSWEQTYHDSGYASVKVLMDVNGTQYGGGFEMNVVNQQINTGRHWFIRLFY